MSESQSPNLSLRPPSVSGVTELVEPVLKKLHKFNPGASYQPEDIRQTIRRIIRQQKIKGLALSPDQNRFDAIPIESDKYRLLVAHCCKVYVDLIMQPRFSHPHLKQKRIPKHQKEFAFELENEIYQLENGEAMFGA